MKSFITTRDVSWLALVAWTTKSTMFTKCNSAWLPHVMYNQTYSQNEICFTTDATVTYNIYIDIQGWTIVSFNDYVAVSPNFSAVSTICWTLCSNSSHLQHTTVLPNIKYTADSNKKNKTRCTAFIHGSNTCESFLLRPNSNQVY